MKDKKKTAVIRAITIGLILICILGFIGYKKANEVGIKGNYPATIMVDGVMYYLKNAMPAEIDPSAIVGYTTSYNDEMPQTNGETNFNRELNMPYAKVEGGIAVLYQNEWWLCKPQTD